MNALVRQEQVSTKRLEVSVVNKGFLFADLPTGSISSHLSSVVTEKGDNFPFSFSFMFWQLDNFLLGLKALRLTLGFLSVAD